MDRPKLTGILIAIVAFLPAVLIAQTQPGESRVELPLDGYYRPGRAMALMVRSASASTSISLVCDGMIPIQIPPGFSGAVPVFILAAAPESTLTVMEGQRVLMKFQLHPLSPEQRLIGIADNSDFNLQSLFPSRNIIPIRLDPDRSWLKSSFLWSLDAILLAQVDEADLPRLLEAGISVAAVNSVAPDSRWPWTRTGSAWILHASAPGPDSIIGGEAVYLPTLAWRQELSSQLRWQLFLAGVLTTLVLLASLLPRDPRLQLAIGTMVSLAACICIYLWFRTAPHVSEKSGNIVVAENGMVQTDHWTYLATSSERGEMLVHPDQPVVLDQAQIEALDLRAIVRKDGGVVWAFVLRPRTKLAMLHRKIEFGTVPRSINSQNASQMEPLARRAYLRPGFQVAGQLRSPRSEWGTTVLVPDPDSR